MVLLGSCAVAPTSSATVLDRLPSVSVQPPFQAFWFCYCRRRQRCRCLSATCGRRPLRAWYVVLILLCLGFPCPCYLRKADVVFATAVILVTTVRFRCVRLFLQIVCVSGCACARLSIVPRLPCAVAVRPGRARLNCCSAESRHSRERAR
jgi:hypothetical protein